MHRRQVLLCAKLLAGALVLAGAGTLAGCPSTAATTSYTPITGVTIESSSLTAGLGCGTGAGQVYAYAALLSYADDAGVSNPPVYSGVFDCYSNGQFSNLPEDDAGGLNFDVQILAWDQASFPSALQCIPSSTSPPSAFSCPGDSVSTVLSDQGTPGWTTTCTATQQLGVSVVAVCAPLVATGSTGHDGGTPDGGDAGDAGDAATAGGPIVIDTHGFEVGDSGSLTCGVGYTTVQATYTVGSQGGTIPAVQCPAPLTLSPTVVGAQYAIEIQLLQGGNDVAQAACQATASTSQVTASCGPATE